MDSLVIVTVLSFLLANNVVLGCYTSIIAFGDSLTDTGNRFFYDPHYFCKKPPYGETFFHRPSGRCCNGRLIIDFIAQALGLPFIPPYLGHTSQDFQNGVNFAVAGATALDSAGPDIHTNYSLGIQLGWFRKLKPSLCNSSLNCRDMFKDALFLVGEIGGNDYNHPFFDGTDIGEIRNIVPNVIAMISTTISALINEGAVTLLVPGNLPVGCSASYLTMYPSKNVEDYDPSTGCLTWLNEFSLFHNSLLQDELERLRELHPDIIIIYADYYNAAMELYRFPNKLGFKRDVLAACCGAGGPYNFDLYRKCGDQGSNACDDPSVYVSWDGVHLTEAAYKWIATALLEGHYTIPRINISCTSSNADYVDVSVV